MEHNNTTVVLKQKNTNQQDSDAERTITTESEQNDNNLQNSTSDVVEQNRISISEDINSTRQSNNNQIEQSNSVIMYIQKNPEETSDSNLFKNILGRFFKKIVYIHYLKKPIINIRNDIQFYIYIIYTMIFNIFRNYGLLISSVNEKMEDYTTIYKIGMYIYLSMDEFFLAWLFYGILMRKKSLYYLLLAIFNIFEIYDKIYDGYSGFVKGEFYYVKMNKWLCCAIIIIQTIISYYIIILANTTFLDIYHKNINSKTVEIVGSSNNNNNNNNVNREGNMSNSNGNSDIDMRNSLVVSDNDRNETVTRDGESVMSISSGNSSIDNPQPLLKHNKRRNKMTIRIDTSNHVVNRSGTSSSGDLSMGSESFRIVKGNSILRGNTVNSLNREISYSPISRINSLSSYGRQLSVMSYSRPGSSIHSNQSQNPVSDPIQFKTQYQIQRKIQHHNNEISSNISDVVSSNNSYNEVNESSKVNTTLPINENEVILSVNDNNNITDSINEVLTSEPAPDYEDPNYDTIPDYSEIYNENNEVIVPVDERCDQTISNFLVDIDLQLQLKEKIESMDIELARNNSMNEMNLPERAVLNNVSSSTSTIDQTQNVYNVEEDKNVNHQKSNENLELSYNPEENVEKKSHLSVNSIDNNELDNISNNDCSNSSINKLKNTSSSNDNTLIQNLSKSNIDFDDTLEINNEGIKKINGLLELNKDASSNKDITQYSLELESPSSSSLTRQNTEHSNSNIDLYKALNSLEHNISKLNESITLINIRNPEGDDNKGE